MAKSKLTHGASVVLWVNGKHLGTVTGISWAVQRPHRVIHEVDSLVPAEMVPGPVRITGTISLLRVERDGGTEGAGLTVPLDQVTRGRYVTLLLMDRRSESVLFQTDKAAITDERWNAAVRGLVAGSVTFECLTYQNEVA